MTQQQIDLKFTLRFTSLELAAWAGQQRENSMAKSGGGGGREAGLRKDDGPVAVNPDKDERSLHEKSVAAAKAQFGAAPQRPAPNAGK